LNLRKGAESLHAIFPLLSLRPGAGIIELGSAQVQNGVETR
jgi:hypothetical protein